MLDSWERCSEIGLILGDKKYENLQLFVKHIPTSFINQYQKLYQCVNEALLLCEKPWITGRDLGCVQYLV